MALHSPYLSLLKNRINDVLAALNYREREIIKKLKSEEAQPAK